VATKLEQVLGVVVFIQALGLGYFVADRYDYKQRVFAMVDEGYSTPHYTGVEATIPQIDTSRFTDRAEESRKRMDELNEMLERQNVRSKIDSAIRDIEMQKSNNRMQHFSNPNKWTDPNEQLNYQRNRSLLEDQRSRLNDIRTDLSH